MSAIGRKTYVVGVALASLAVSACGGGSDRGGFDEEALRVAIVARATNTSGDAVDRAVDAIREACTSDNDFVLPMMHDDTPAMFELAEVACPERTALVTD